MSRLLILFFALITSACTTGLKLSSQAPEDGFQASLVSYRIEGGRSFSEMIQKMEDLVRRAKRQGSELVLFPEYVVLDQLNIGSFEDEKQELKRIAGSFNAYMNEMKRLAVLYQINIVAGSSPRIVAGQLKNVSPYISMNGDVYFQEKLFLTPWEKKHGFRSGSEVQVISSPWGNIVNLICFDIESPLISERLIDWQPSLFFVGAMTESQAGAERVKRTAQARAVEHHAFVLVASAAGEPTDSWKMYGRSAFYSPQEAKENFGEHSSDSELRQIFVPISRLEMSRKQTGFWPAKESAALRDLIRVRSASSQRWKGPTPRLP